MPRALDHAVLPVTSLAAARARYEALGFTVNADGFHPFGTANCCIFFKNDTYLEPLAIYDAVKVAQAVSDQNPFVRMDHDFRQAFGDEGFACFAMKSDDIESDDQAYQKAGVDTRNRLAFTREVKHADGNSDILSVKGGFCVRSTLPGCAFFTLEWLGNPDVVKRIRSAPEHQNGAIGVSEVYFVAERFDEALDYLSVAFDAKPENPASGQACFGLPGLDVNVSSPDRVSGFLPEFDERLIEFGITAYTIEVTDLEKIVFNLTNARIAHQRIDQAIFVPHAEGQGTALLFKEKSD